MSLDFLRFPAFLGCLAALIVLTSCRDAEPPTHEEIVRSDLAAILDLQGSPCGEVVAHAQDQRLDYRVECSNGNVYRIHVSAEGHVNIKDHPKQR